MSSEEARLLLKSRSSEALDTELDLPPGFDGEDRGARPAGRA